MQNNAPNIYDYKKRTVRDLPDILEKQFQMTIRAISYDEQEMLFSVGQEIFRVNVPKTPSWNIISPGLTVLAQKEIYQGNGQNSDITYGKLHLLAVLNLTGTNEQKQEIVETEVVEAEIVEPSELRAMFNEQEMDLRQENLEKVVDSLNEGQKAVYDAITSKCEDPSHTGVFFITSQGGCGKTYLAKAIALFFLKKFREVVAVAPTHRAKNVLRKSMGYETSTIARHCGYILEEPETEEEIAIRERFAIANTDKQKYDNMNPEEQKEFQALLEANKDKQKKPKEDKVKFTDASTIEVNAEGEFVKQRDTPETNVLIADEASMISQLYFEDMAEHTKVLILLGDQNQLPPVKAEAIEFDKIETYHLTEQMRQENIDTSLFKNLQILVDRLEGRAIMPEPYTFDDSFIKSDNLVKDYMDGKIEVIFAYRNLFVDAYNDEIQRQKTGDTKIVDNDTLIAKKPIISINGKSMPNGKHVYPVYKNNGDKMKVLHVHTTQPEVGMIVELDINDEGEGTRLVLSREQWATRDFVWELWKSTWKPMMQWRHFKKFAINASLPYAMTVHGSQGGTFNNVGVNLGDIENGWEIKTIQQLSYVAMSRAKHKCYVKL